MLMYCEYINMLDVKINYTFQKYSGNEVIVFQNVTP
jgi:hypothetical protein